MNHTYSCIRRKLTCRDWCYYCRSPSPHCTRTALRRSSPAARLEQHPLLKTDIRSDLRKICL